MLVAVALVACSSVNEPKGKVSVLGNRYRKYVGSIRNPNVIYPTQDNYYYKDCWDFVDFYSEDSLRIYYSNEEHNWEPIDSLGMSYSEELGRRVSYWYEIDYPYITVEWAYVKNAAEPKSKATPWVIIDENTLFSSNGNYTKFDL